MSVVVLKGNQTNELHLKQVTWMAHIAKPKGKCQTGWPSSRLIESRCFCRLAYLKVEGGHARNMTIMRVLATAVLFEGNHQQKYYIPHFNWEKLLMVIWKPKGRLINPPLGKKENRIPVVIDSLLKRTGDLFVF